MHRRGSAGRIVDKKAGTGPMRTRRKQTEKKFRQNLAVGSIDRSFFFSLPHPNAHPFSTLSHLSAPARTKRGDVRCATGRPEGDVERLSPRRLPWKGGREGTEKQKNKKKSERNFALIVESTSSKEKVEKKYQQQTTPPPPPPPPFLFKNSSSRQRAPPRSPRPPRRCSAPARR